MKIINKLLASLLVVVSLSSCGEDRMLCYVCDAQQKLKTADFITQNMAAANNKSDEEMEDVIKELRQTAVKIHCDQVKLPCTYGGSLIYEKIELDSAQTLFRYFNYE